MKFYFLLFVLLSFPGWAKWSVSTYNIRNFDRDPDAGATNLRELSNIIKSVQSDVMVFEEVVNEVAFEALIKSTLPGYAYEISSCGGYGKQHLAVVYNSRTFEFMEQTEDLSFSGSRTGCGSLRPVLLVSLKQRASGKVFIFGAVHLKAGGNADDMSQRWQQYAKLEALSIRHAKDNLILLGDFNTTGYNIRNEDYARFDDFIRGQTLTTMAETLGCTNYWAGLNGGEEHQSSVLDHIILNSRNLSSVASVRAGAHCAKTSCRPATPTELGTSYQSVSDHCPVQVTFK